MPYLEQSNPEPGCVFCLAAEDPSSDDRNYVVYRGNDVFVMLNLYPYNSGHLMVIPHRHVGDLNELSPEIGTAIFTTAQRVLTVMRDVLKPDGFNLGINQGGVAGAGIEDHLHLHVVPRWSGDTNFMPVLADAKVMPELLSRTAAKLREGFQRLAA